MGLSQPARPDLLSRLAHRVSQPIGSSPLPNALAVFPLVIFASLRVPPLARLLSLRPLTFLGDISYAVYLCHVPLQMIFLAVVRSRRMTLATGSPWLLVGFAVVLISTATAAHYGFERPMRRWLRSRTEEVAAAPDASIAA